MRGGAEPPRLSPSSCRMLLFLLCPATLLKRSWCRRGISSPQRRGRPPRKDLGHRRPRGAADAPTSMLRPRRWPPRGAGALLQERVLPPAVLAALLLAAGDAEGEAPSAMGKGAP